MSGWPHPTLLSAQLNSSNQAQNFGNRRLGPDWQPRPHPHQIGARAFNRAGGGGLGALARSRDLGRRVEPPPRCQFAEERSTDGVGDEVCTSHLGRGHGGI